MGNTSPRRTRRWVGLGAVLGLVAAAFLLIYLVVSLSIYSSLVIGPGPTLQSRLQYQASDYALRMIPPQYLQLYEEAGLGYGIDWTILAGIGFIECRNGTSDAPGCHSGANPSGAMGPMQFEAGTWQRYGVGGDGDGNKDVYNPADAIPAAANYLQALGAGDPQKWKSSLCHFNAGYGAAYARCMVDENPQSYAVAVLAEAARYRAPSTTNTSWGFPVELPIPAINWIEKIRVPAFPPDLTKHIKITNQCVAGAYATWWLMHRDDPQWDRWIFLAGNAIDQVASALSSGWHVRRQAVVGSMAVWGSIGQFGHIATVVAVAKDRFEVVEQNWLNTSGQLSPQWGTFSLHVFPSSDAGILGFIVAPG
jgi:surface antigen